MQNTWIPQIQCLENVTLSHAYSRWLVAEERVSLGREAEVAQSQIRGQNRSHQSIAHQRGRQRSQKSSDEDGSKAREEERSDNRLIFERRDQKGCWPYISIADFLPRSINSETAVRCAVRLVQDECRYFISTGHEWSFSIDCLCVF